MTSLLFAAGRGVMAVLGGFQLGSWFSDETITSEEQKKVSITVVGFATIVISILIAAIAYLFKSTRKGGKRWK